MNNKDYTTRISVNVSPEKAFKCINNIAKWWSGDLEGSSQKLHDVFTVHFGEIFITNKVIEWLPDKKVVWLVTDCHKTWLKNKKEWNGTRISFEIKPMGDSTEVLLTHIGLVPEVECYGVCSNAWDQYIKGSLFNFLTTGEGLAEPRPKAI